MSDQPEPGTAPETTDTAPAETPDPDDMNVVQPQSDLADDTDTNPNHEAARWRVKAREAEQQRDALAAQLETLRKDQINATVVTMGLRPQALWASGVELTDLIGDDGVPDQQKIRQAVESARTELGIERPRKPIRSLTSGVAAPKEQPADWRSAFAPRREQNRSQRPGDDTAQAQAAAAN